MDEETQQIYLMTHQQKIQRLAIPSRFFSVKQLMKAPAFPVAFPFWHTISDEKLPHIESLYRTYTSNEFKKTLDELFKHFTPIDIEEVVSQNFSPGKAYMHISFDDGLKEIHDIAAPILREKGIPASFFVNPGFINDKDIMFRYEVSFLIKKINSSSCNTETKQGLTKRLLQCKSIDNDLRTEVQNHLDEKLTFPDREIYMKESEIQKLYDEGFHIGAHSMTHPLYSCISQGQKIQETADSVNYIQEKWPSKVRSFAFPFTDDGILSQELKQIHNDSKLTLSFGTAGYARHPELNHFQRIPMEHSKLFPAMQIMKAELLASKLKRKHR